MNRRRTFCSIAGLLSLAAGRAFAQQQTASMTPKWGTAGFTIQTVGAFAFQPLDPAAVYANDTSMNRWIVSGGSNCWAAPLSLPSGAVLDHIELDGCNTTDTDDLSAELLYCAIAGTCVQTDFVDTLSNPGCGRFPSLSSPVTIDNLNAKYVVMACTPGSGSTQLSAVRAYYQLEVSPAPDVQTFLDVPKTNPYYQFVEALAVSGITAGCGGGNYCPDSPVTRGQLAAFLAKALGLFWPY
jgi:hypothetical protein